MSDQFAWNGLHPVSPPQTPAQSKSNLGSFTLAPADFSRQFQTTSSDNFTIEEVDPNSYATDVEVLRPDEYEEYRSEDSDTETESSHPFRFISSATNNNNLSDAHNQDTSETDSTTSETSAVARRLRRLRTQEAPCTTDLLKGRRFAHARSRAIGTVMAGKKRGHAESIDNTPSTSTTPDTGTDDSENGLAPDDHDNQTSARRLRRRLRGPRSSFSHNPPDSPATAEEVMSDVGDAAAAPPSDALGAHQQQEPERKQMTNGVNAAAAADDDMDTTPDIPA